METWKVSFLKGLETIGELTSTAMVFVAIGLLSYGVGLLVHLMQAHGGDPVSVLMLQFAERAILFVDIFGLICRVVKHSVLKPLEE